MNERAEIFARLKAGARILVLGDSLSAGMGCSESFDTGELLLACDGDRYTRWHAPNGWHVHVSQYLREKFPGCTLQNNGCSGIYSYQLEKGLSQVYDGTADIVLLLVGVNDRKREKGREELEKSLPALLSRFRADGAVPVLITPNPSTAENEMLPTRFFHSEEIVNIIRYIAARENVILADCWEEICRYSLYTGQSIDALMHEDGCMSDGLHPTDRVYRLMASCILRAMGLCEPIPGAPWSNYVNH